jgi:hypothetical protein
MTDPEQLLAAFETMAPAARAVLAAGHILYPDPCDCLCSIVHHEDTGICEGDAVSTLHFQGGEIPMCRPCLLFRLRQGHLLNGCRGIFVTPQPVVPRA